MKKPIVLIAAIVAVVGLCAAVAVAKETTKVPTTVSLHIRWQTDTFWGNVTAKKGCKRHREVRLHEKTGRGGVRGSDTTNDHGKYRMKQRIPSGARGYFVSAKKKVIDNDGEEIVCKRARSVVVWNR